jgi:predicted nucleic acid-binding protein
VPGTVFVLDSSAVVRFLDKEAGWSRVAAILEAHRDQTAEAAISAIQWGEIAGVVRKKRGATAQKTILDHLSLFQLRVEAATAERAVRAAEIKQDRQLPYADAFALELAMDSADHLLLTADYDFKAVADLARIEFLPMK